MRLAAIGGSPYSSVALRIRVETMGELLLG